MATHPDARGVGVGSAILDLLLDHLAFPRRESRCLGEEGLDLVDGVSMGFVHGEGEENEGEEDSLIELAVLM